MSAVAAAIGATAAIGGSLIASSGAKKAAQTQAQAAQDANAAQERMFQQQTQLQEPFRQAGLTAQQRLMYLLGIGPRPMKQRMVSPARTVGAPNAVGQQQPMNAFVQSSPISAPREIGYNAISEGGVNDYSNINDLGAFNFGGLGNFGGFGPVDMSGVSGGQYTIPAQYEMVPDETDAEFGKYGRDFGMADFQQDPGYAFRQSEGMKALERSAAARGGLLSGKTLKGIQRFGQDLASQEYANAFNRYQINRSNQLNPLQSLMGAGQSSTNLLTGAAGQMGQNEANNLYNAGAARASGYVGSANALGGALGSIGSAAFQYPTYKAQTNYLNSLSNANQMANYARLTPDVNATMNANASIF